MYVTIGQVETLAKGYPWPFEQVRTAVLGLDAAGWSLAQIVALLDDAAGAIPNIVEFAVAMRWLGDRADLDALVPRA